MNKKKVIFLMPTLGEGGGERVLSELSQNLPDYIERIIVLFKNQVSYPYKGKLVSLDIPLSNNFIFRIYYFFIAVLRMKKLVKLENPDYVISFATPANIINIFSSGDKAVLRVDTFLSSLPDFKYRLLAKIFFRRALKIICVSKGAAKDLALNFNVKEEKIKVIYNPLDIKKIKSLALSPIKKEYEEIFKNPVIINIGRLAAGKNHFQLVKIFREVKKEIKEARLVILGAGKLKPQLENDVKESGLENSVHFLGWRENPFSFLARAKLFVLPSSREGLPYSILEAMAVGLPVISTDCKSGPREILAPDTDIFKEADAIEYVKFGILTPVFEKESNKLTGRLTKNEQIFKEAIIKVLNDKNMADSLSLKSLQRAEDFDIMKIIKEWSFL
ncbi:MAG: glycosyltransferase [Candidatus Staskawiczbacteria bacterium]|nr:glycosyltransferase [Candidatus Staskawiczbacteria bacterium]